MGKTLFEKIWDRHLVASIDESTNLVFIDLHLVHEVTSPQAFDSLRLAGRKVKHPEMTLATVDHGVPTSNRLLGIKDPLSKIQIEALENNCEELILIGGVKKPNLWLLKPDFGALKLFFKLVMLPSKGDASILKTLLQFLEIDNKFKVVGAEKYIPHLLMSEGLLAGEKIDKQTQIDIDIAIANCINIGFKDIGQACVVVNGEIITSEDVSGTDNMLRNLVSKEIKFSKKGVLVKLTKPIQDKRVDLPVIGMQTIHLVKEIGLKGIAIENRSSFILEKEQVIKFANDNEIFIYGFNNECA